MVVNERVSGLCEELRPLRTLLLLSECRLPERGHCSVFRPDQRWQLNGTASSGIVYTVVIILTRETRVGQGAVGGVSALISTTDQRRECEIKRRGCTTG